MRVYQIARALRMESMDMRTWLRKHGIYTPSPSTNLDPILTQTVFAVWTNELKARDNA